jgi:hypothetical protein
LIGTSRVELEPVSWSEAPMLLVLRNGAVIGAVLPVATRRQESPEWIAAASAEVGGTAWPCASQAEAVDWLVAQSERRDLHDLLRHLPGHIEWET